MTNDNLKMKGFTLIELLAVIVILAVIALIAVPRIIEILNKSRLSAAEDSTYGIVEAAESYIANFMLQNQGAIPSEDLKFSCNNEGCTLANELTNYNTENLKTLEFKGKKPTSGAITISENGNKVTVYGLLINNFICNYGDGNADCIDISDIGATKENPPLIQHEGVKAIVYLDPTDFANKCTSENYKETNSATGTKTGCMKWYVYAEDDNTYTMILDHNTSSGIAWNSTGGNSMKEVALVLSNDTSNWNSSLNARLINAEEIVEITKKENFNITNINSSFYFQTLDQDALTGAGSVCAQLAEGCKYAWVYDRTDAYCKNWGCLNNSTDINDHYGYWTSTPTGDGHAWSVVKDGSFGTELVTQTDHRGVRPVITISKLLIKN